MTASNYSNTSSSVLVAVDIAKYKHFAFAEFPDGSKKKLVFDNSRDGFFKFKESFLSGPYPVSAAIEPTGDYHRVFAHFLLTEGVDLKLINTIAMARMRDALQNSWNKNDPRDAQVIFHMLKNGHTQIFHAPRDQLIKDLKEMAALHIRLTRTKTKIQHTILNHYLPLYFPEGKMFFSGSKVRWITRFLKHFPVPASVIKHSVDEFVETAWDYLDHVPFREKVLRAFHEACSKTIGIPTSETSWEAKAFQETLTDHADLNDRLRGLEKHIVEELKDDPQYKILIGIPGIGPIIAMNIIAESGDLKRFRHPNQYIKYMGLNLCSSQSGLYQGKKSISKRGNSRLRSILWLATRAAISSCNRSNGFKMKYTSMIKNSPLDGDIKRKALTACTAKMARVIHKLVTNNISYRPFQGA